MENDNAKAMQNWNSSSFAMEIGANCFFDNSMYQSDPFESAMSSIVSSPVPSNTGGISGDNVMIRELIGRLGSICNSGEVSPQSYINSTNASCYNTPLNSPPKLNVSMLDQHMRGNIAPFPADPEFSERAARFSCFGARNLGSLNSQFGVNETELAYASIPRSESNKKFNRFSRSSTPENGEIGDSREGSSVSEQIQGGEMKIKGQRNEAANPRKRKPVARGKGKDSIESPKDNKVATQVDESNSKKSKLDSETEKDGEKKKEETNGNQKQNNDNSKPPEPQKDYIHVRARRGQATDSHSLAERVRREKIGERMKFLQDLVPGCNKVTGKAVMLDEIINYVQSLQCQVEFLSMKLATVNPRVDLNVESLLAKDIYHSRGSLPNNNYPVELLPSPFPYGYQSQEVQLHNGVSNGAHTQFPVDLLNAAVRQNPSMQLQPADGFGEGVTQVPGFWGDDLQSIVHMGLSQDQPQSFNGSVATGQMKMEL